MKVRNAFLALLANLILLAALLPCAQATSHTNIQTVFIILMENVSWPDIAGSANAPFINQVLIPQSSYCNNMYIVPNTFGSLPQYLWLESGTNWGVTSDSSDPTAHHFNTTNHLVVQLQNAGISWKAYQESTSGTSCPTASSGFYAAFHNPFIYFDDIYLSSTNCTNHIRPYTEFARDLTNDTVARYTFITPNLCNCMHGAAGCPAENRILTGDKWLAQEIPKITNSTAYQNRGAIIVTWDEGTANVGGPFGTIVLSQFAKGGGYRNTNRLDHTATFRTLQEIFNVPFLFAAKNATSLSDLFKPAINLSASVLNPGGQFQLTASGIVPGKTNYFQFASNLVGNGNWTGIMTNVLNTNRFTFIDTNAGSSQRFYRVLEAY